MPADVADSGVADTANAPVSERIDCSGMQCPGPISGRVFETMKGLKENRSAGSFRFGSRILAGYCRLVENRKHACFKCPSGNDYIACVKRQSGSRNKETPQGKTIIVFGDLDKVLASFIIANGAAAMGRPSQCSFTYLTSCKRKTACQKTRMEAMFKIVFPRGIRSLNFPE